MANMNTENNDEIIVMYSPGYEYYYLKNIQSQLISAQSYETHEDALDDLTTEKVIWIMDT